MKACLRPLAILALPILLAACQSQPAASLVGRPPAGPPQRPGTPALPAPAVPPASPLNSADLINDPQRFKGMSLDAVTALLGRPSFQRRDADAEIWQYYGPSSACVLDLFVYPVPEGGSAQVAYAELRSRGGASSAAAACMAQIIDGKRG